MRRAGKSLGEPYRGLEPLSGRGSPLGLSHGVQHCVRCPIGHELDGLVEASGTIEERDALRLLRCAAPRNTRFMRSQCFSCWTSSRWCHPMTGAAVGVSAMLVQCIGLADSSSSSVPKEGTHFALRPEQAAPFAPTNGTTMDWQVEADREDHARDGRDSGRWRAARQGGRGRAAGSRTDMQRGRGGASQHWLLARGRSFESGCQAATVDLSSARSTCTRSTCTRLAAGALVDDGKSSADELQHTEEVDPTRGLPLDCGRVRLDWQTRRRHAHERQKDTCDQEEADTRPAK